jgi:hypothetical protein
LLLFINFYSCVWSVLGVKSRKWRGSHDCPTIANAFAT